MSKLISFAIVTLSLWLSGCASQPIKPTYVSPAGFQSWNCAQLHQEYTRLTQHIKQGVEPKTRQHVGFGIGLGGGWGRHGGWGVVPQINIGMGQSAASERSTLAELYGQQEAIAQAAQFKNCPIQPSNTSASS